MNLKKILTITLLLIAFMLSTVSASDIDAKIVTKSENHNILGDNNVPKFNFVVKETVSIKNKDAVVLSFDWPEGTIEPDVVTVRRGGIDIDQRGKFKKTNEKFTLNDLGISSVGTYSFNIYFGDDNYLKTVTIKVTENDDAQTQKTDSNPVKLTLKKVAVKKSAKKLVLTSTLKKGKTALKKEPVTFKFNGKTYKINTNNKGIAKLTIKKAVLKKLKVGKKVTYQVSYGSKVKKFTVKVKK